MTRVTLELREVRAHGKGPRAAIPVAVRGPLASAPGGCAERRETKEEGEREERGTGFGVSF
ncbi:hypothetical protein ASC82_21890 [Streptomyces sp. Root431]|nr:hypothetical protein ASC82_21890 [Streptomyces sp. Root431]